jgi:hypothetical protein
MKARSPLILAAALALVLLYGLGSLLVENIRVAPEAEHAAEHRMTPHMKNVTRFIGSPEEVGRQVHRAVVLDETPPRLPPDEQWHGWFREQYRTDGGARHLLVVPGDNAALAWALPGLFWAAYSGAPVVFVSGGALEETGAELLRRHANLPVFVLAPSNLVSDDVLDRLRSGERRVERVAANSLAAHAVKIAEYREEESEFGWGRTYDRRDGYFEYVITTPAEARSGLAALPLAISNSAALLFAGDDGGIPGVLDRYAFKQRADWFVTPAEGPFRHFFIVGDRVSYAAQARLDFALEKGPYASAGPDALGAMEGLAIVFIALGFAGAIFVWYHAIRLLPELMPAMRIAWTFTALLVPVLGVVLYFAAHRRPTHAPDEEHAHVRFMRPPSMQSVAATAMGFGYGAPTMIVIGFAFVYFGFPLFYGRWADGGQFLFGAGMPLMMAGMWAGAVLLAWLCAQAPMMKMMMPKMSAGMRYRRTLGVTAVSMTAVSLGMMTSAWVLQMSKLPMMPKEDDILWFGAMWLASAVGFLIAWPLNYPLVRVGWKMGGA